MIRRRPPFLPPAVLALTLALGATSAVAAGPVLRVTPLEAQGDPTQAQLARGLTELLRTDLARVPAVTTDEAETERVAKGSLLSLGADLRLDVRVLATANGEVLQSQVFRSTRDELWRLHVELLPWLVAQAGEEAGDVEASIPTRSADAFLAWSSGLEARDRGDEDGARAQFEAAVRLDPDFTAAADALASPRKAP